MIQQQSNSFIKLYIFIAIIYVYFMEINLPQGLKSSFFATMLMIFVSFSIFAQHLSKVVDTQIGSEGSGLGCGYNFVGATYPFGMVQFTPSFFSPQKGFVIS